MSKDRERVVDPGAKIVLSGASGMLGGALQKHLRALKISFVSLVRGAQQGRVGGPAEVRWDPSARPAMADPSPLEGSWAAIHLSGANLAGRRWTEAYKRELVDSRVNSTRALSEMLAGRREKPETLIVASGVGIYGDRGDEVLDESSAVGAGFLADLCHQWEDAAQAARDAGIRVVHARFGIALARGPGALGAMLPIFRAGLGGPIGSGRQWMSWIALQDLIAAMEFVLKTPALVGPVNVTSPHPIRNADFAKALGRQLHRPAVLPAPAFALRLALGEMADEALLASERVLPAKLMAAGFRFTQPALEDALAGLGD
jgi:uncharacterized protein